MNFAKMHFVAEKVRFPSIVTLAVEKKIIQMHQIYV